MKLWKKAAGALKDKNSIFLASLSSRRNSVRTTLDIHSAVIKATSHNEHRVDYRNTHRIFRWIPQSPDANLRSFSWALSVRMEKTRDWTVALKGLVLMHGVLSCRVPAVQNLGRLPFNLSNFSDAHLSPSKSWPYNTFIRSYFAFLDQKSDMNASSIEPKELQTRAIQLYRLQKLQILLDLLLQIKPISIDTVKILILEATDCVIIEIFDIYSKICTGIALLLTTIDVSNRTEAVQSLKILHKAAEQGIKLNDYFEFCRKIGVMKASEKPLIPIIPIDEMRELERAVNSSSGEEKAIVIVDDRMSKINGARSDFCTIITDQWEVFDENGDHNYQLAIVDCSNGRRYDEYEDLPDLISF